MARPTHVQERRLEHRYAVKEAGFFETLLMAFFAR